MTGYIHNETKRIITKYQTRDPFELLDRMGVNVVFTQEYGSNGLKGYSTMLNRIKFAVINACLSKHEQAIVAGHEAAHLILHVNEILNSPIKALQDFSMFDNNSKIEYQANLFLADLILDDQAVMDYVHDDNMDFFSIASSLYVPPPLFAFSCIA